MLTKTLANKAAVHDGETLSGALSDARGFASGLDSTATSEISPRSPSESLKRLMDLMIAVPMALFLLPAYALLAVIIYSDDKGPVLFKQSRRGQNGEYFTCLKFRTMVTDATARLERVLDSDPALRAEWEATQKLKEDPRITGIGGFLRKYSLDELPQLWNIIKGEMSIVGPRPIVEDEVRRYGADIDHYDEVRPGVVGLWQISGRNDTSYDERVQLDVTYAQTRNILLDLKILFGSIPAILLKRGAY